MGNVLPSLPTHSAWQAGIPHLLCTFLQQDQHIPKAVGRAEQAQQQGPCCVSVLSDASGNISSALLTPSPQSHVHPPAPGAIHTLPEPPILSQSHPNPVRGTGTPPEPSTFPQSHLQLLVRDFSPMAARMGIPTSKATCGLQILNEQNRRTTHQIS